MRKKLILDIDGVIRDIIPQIVWVYNIYYAVGKVTESNITEWDLSKCLPLIKDTKRFFIENGIEIFVHSEPFPETLSALDILKREFDTVLVSHQYEEIRHYTDVWLERHKIDIPVIYTADKNQVTGDIIVDDYYKHLDKHNATYKYLMHANYNKHITGYSRIYNLYHLIHELG